MKNTMRLVAGLCLLAAWGARTASAQYQYPFQNPDLPTEERVRNIVSLMTVDEKIFCLGTDPSVPRLGIHGTRHVEGLHGLALGGPGGWGRPTPIPTTQFAQAIGMGETWDPELVCKAGGVEGNETRYIFQSEKTGHRGGLVVRAPNADLGRDPRWGRTEECFGEDAFFNGTMVVAMVKGLQGDDPKYWLTASLMKHFLANSNEDGRDGSSSNFDERLLREYYSVPFRMGVMEGGSRAYMASYNAMNGIPMTANPILKDITVKEWGQDGIICTDAGSLWNMVNRHKYYADLPHAAAGAVQAGINQFLDRIFGKAVHDALNQNLLTEPEIDAVLKNEFRVMIKLGMLDPPERVPYTKIKGDEDAWKLGDHKAVAKRVALESVVLLKNAGGLLPLDRSAVKSVAVIGPRANDVALDWYSGTPPYTITPLDGIKAVAGAVKVNYAANNDDEAAVNAAKQSDMAIVFVGNHPTCGAPWAHCPTPSDGKEAMDRKWIDLEQEALVKQVYAANPKTVVVLVSSFPIAINWTEQNVPAILHITHNAQEEGSAIAEVLFGDYNPGGRLVQTFPRSLDQVPAKMDYDIRHGRTYMYFQGNPLYPFGYGLSYTTFRYSNLKTSAATLRASGEITVSVDVTNTGKRQGDEVVQLYVKHLNSGVERPIKELKGFRRVTLAPGQTRTVELPLKAETLAYWDMARERWEVEADQVSLMVGSSSADVKLDKTVAVVR
ncbi:MAG TPA: glycoside hydrolase family 3 C-terminal domain-containing protein [Bryobacteraceae bacterium]|jgi:beta-glucosidase